MVVGTRAWVGLASALLVACSGDRADSVGDSLGAGKDGGARDGGLAADAEPARDEPDGSDDATIDEEDAGELDAGEPDTEDAGEPDAGELDAGDAGPFAVGDGAVGLPFCVGAVIAVPLSVALTADNEVDALYVDGQPQTFSNPGSGWGSVKVASTSIEIYAGAPIVVAAIGRNTSNQGGFDRGLIASITVGNTTLDSSARWRVSGTEQGSWMLPGFDDSGWQNAVVLGANGVAPWSVITGISPDAAWIWSYDPTTVADAPTDEPNYFRFSFAVDEEGIVIGAPTCRPQLKT